VLHEVSVRVVGALLSPPFPFRTTGVYAFVLSCRMLLYG